MFEIKIMTILFSSSSCMLLNEYTRVIYRILLCMVCFCHAHTVAIVNVKCFSASMHIYYLSSTCNDATCISYIK